MVRLFHKQENVRRVTKILCKKRLKEALHNEALCKWLNDISSGLFKAVSMYCEPKSCWRIELRWRKERRKGQPDTVFQECFISSHHYFQQMSSLDYYDDVICSVSRRVVIIWNTMYTTHATVMFLWTLHSIVTAPVFHVARACIHTNFHQVRWR